MSDDSEKPNQTITKKKEETSVLLVADDILELSFQNLLPDSLLAGVFGFFAALLLYLGVLVLFPTLQADSATLLAVETVPAASLFSLGLIRNKLVRRLAGRKFSSVHALQRVIDRLPVLGTGLALIGFLVVRSMPPVTLILAAFFFLFSVPRYVVSRLLKQWNEGRLCLQQFLAEKSRCNPSYSWLRLGLRTVAERLEEFGLSSSTRALFLGASHFLFIGTHIDSNLIDLGNWLVDSKAHKVDVIVTSLLSQAKSAEEAGFKAAPRLTEYLGDLPWQKISYAVGATAGIVGIILLVLGYLRTL